MRNHHANCEDLALMRGLRNRGIPVDEFELERMKAACARLEILEDPGLPSTVFNLSCGGTGYLLNVGFENYSERPLAPTHVSFEAPDWETGMSLLADPHKQYPALRGNIRRQVRDHRGVPLDYSIVRDTYFFPNDWTVGYGREAVLNHRIARSCFLYPGEPLEGWLMVVGQKPIPLEYRDRDRFKVHLTVFDQRGRFHRATFHPMVQRSRQEERSGGASSGCRAPGDHPKPNLGQENEPIQVVSAR